MNWIFLSFFESNPLILHCNEARRALVPVHHLFGCLNCAQCPLISKEEHNFDKRKAGTSDKRWKNPVERGKVFGKGLFGDFSKRQFTRRKNRWRRLELASAEDLPRDFWRSAFSTKPKRFSRNFTPSFTSNLEFRNDLECYILSAEGSTLKVNLPEPGTRGQVLLWLSATSITRYAFHLADLKKFWCVFPLFLTQ